MIGYARSPSKVRLSRLRCGSSQKAAKGLAFVIRSWMETWLAPPRAELRRGELRAPSRQASSDAELRQVVGATHRLVRVVCRRGGWEHARDRGRPRAPRVLRIQPHPHLRAACCPARSQPASGFVTNCQSVIRVEAEAWSRAATRDGHAGSGRTGKLAGHASQGYAGRFLWVIGYERWRDVPAELTSSALYYYFGQLGLGQALFVSVSQRSVLMQHMCEYNSVRTIYVT